VYTNFAIGPISWQLESDFYVDAILAIIPINWQLELDQGIT
jgi:hypothetical protein